MIELKAFFDAKVQFGHKTSSWSPQMAPYIWGSKNKIHLIDISKTAVLLNRAAEFLREVGRENQQILLVGTKKAAQPIIRKIAEAVEMPFVVNRWIGGTLSNFPQVKKAITRYLHLLDVLKKSGDLYTKKELSTLKKEIARLEKNIGGIVKFSYPPACIVVVDAKKEHAAIQEALRLKVPVIAIVDTNTDPRGINFVIPGNDDSTQSIEFLLKNLMAAFEEGRSEAKKVAAAKAQAKAAEEAAKKAEKATMVKQTPVVEANESKKEPSEANLKRLNASIKEEQKEAEVQAQKELNEEAKKEAAAETKEVSKKAAAPAEEKETSKKASAAKAQPIAKKKATSKK